MYDVSSVMVVEIREAKLVSLIAFTNYSVKVAAVTAVGVGVNSRSLTCRSLEGSKLRVIFITSHLLINNILMFSYLETIYQNLLLQRKYKLSWLIRKMPSCPGQNPKHPMGK